MSKNDEMQPAIKGIAQLMGDAMAKYGLTDCIIIIHKPGIAVEMMHGDTTGALKRMHSLFEDLLNSKHVENFKTEHDLPARE